MTDHFELVGTALTFADLGSIVQKTVQRHLDALECIGGPPWVHDYQPKIEAVLQSVNATTEVLKHASVQLDRETLGGVATTAVRKSALKAFNSCDNAFESIHRYYLQHPSENMRPSYRLDEYDRLPRYLKRLEKARTSLLLILAVLQLRKDMSASNETNIPLQRLQIENLVTQIKAMDQDIDDSASGNGESNAGSDSSWDIRSRDSTPRSTISNHRDGSRDSKARSPFRHRLSWVPSMPGSEPRCTSAEPPRRRTSITRATSPAAPPIDPFLPIPDDVPPFMAKPTFANLLMQTAHSASAFSEMLATETYGWYNSNRVYMNSIRCALDILNQNFGDLLVSYEQSMKEGSDAPPPSLTNPFPTVDLADQAPKKKSKKSKEKKKGTKKAQKESKFTECWEPPVTNMAPPPLPIELFADPFADLQNFVGTRDVADDKVSEEVLVPKAPGEKKTKVAALDGHAADIIETSALPDPKFIVNRDHPGPPASEAVNGLGAAQREARDPAYDRTQQFRAWQNMQQPAARSTVRNADSQGWNAANDIPTVAETDPVDDWDTFAVIGKKGKKTHKKPKKSAVASKLLSETEITSTMNEVDPPRKKHSRKAAGELKDNATDGLIEPPPPPSEKDMIGGLAFPFPPTSCYISPPPPPPPRSISEVFVPAQKERKTNKGFRKHGYFPATAESVKDDDWIWNQMRSHAAGARRVSQKPKDPVDDLLQQWTTGDAMSSGSEI